MPDLTFRIETAEPVKFAVSPLLALRLRVSNAVAGETIHSVVLRSQIEIETTRRHYTPDEQERLVDLFGAPERWGTTLRTMLWTHANVIVPRFIDGTLVDLPVPCSFDFNVAATKYFDGLTNGDIPLCCLFSGTVFYAAGEDQPLQVAPIPWEKEATFRLPVQTWRNLMDHYYPNSAWLCLRRDAFDLLHQYKMRHGIPTWEETLERLVPVATDVVRS